MIQTKSFLIFPPFNNLFYWVENTSSNIEELRSAYYELEEIINNKKKDYIIQKDTTLGEVNTMRISFWCNMN